MDSESLDVTAAGAGRREAAGRAGSSGLFEAVVESAPLALVLVDEAGVVQLWNAKAEQLFGWTHDEALGRPFPPAAADGVRDEFRTNVRDALAGRPAAGLETRRYAKDGRALDVGLWTAPIRIEGRTAGVLALFADIGERKRALEAQAILAAIVRSSDDAIIGLALDGRIVSWNGGAERIFGYSAAEVLGHVIAELAPPERHDEMPKMLGIVKRGGRIEHFETVRVHKDGHRIDISLTVSPIQDASGRVVGASKIGRDVGASKRAERDLIAAKEAAEAANRAKDHFLAVLSHELRTPLAPVLALVSGLERSERLPEHLRADVAMIRRNVELEARLIDDLLDLTRIARGKLQLYRGVVDVRQAIKDALRASWMLDQEDKHLRLDLQLQGPDRIADGDGPRITQVLWNLLHNAIKFTPAGGRISVTTRLLGEPADPATTGGTQERTYMVIEVADNGIGIPPDVLPHVFDAFDQGHDTRTYGGLGIGLTISRAIVEMHGGTLTAASEGEGKGAVFTVRLPYCAPAAQQEPQASGRGGRAPADETAATRLHILLVEDHADTADAMSALLSGMGFDVTVAGTIADAERVADGDRPVGLLISDLDLPDGSGLTLMRALADRHGLRGIALSGFGMEEDIRRSREAGFERHLTKPVNLDLLERAIHEIAGS